MSAIQSPAAVSQRVGALPQIRNLRCFHDLLRTSRRPYTRLQSSNAVILHKGRIGRDQHRAYDVSTIDNFQCDWHFLVQSCLIREYKSFVKISSLCYCITTFRGVAALMTLQILTWLVSSIEANPHSHLNSQYLCCYKKCIYFKNPNRCDSCLTKPMLCMALITIAFWNRSDTSTD